MGRNSVEATKASLIRADRARLTAWLAFLLGLRPFLPAVLGFLVVCAGLLAAVFAVEEAGAAGVVAELPEDCPATGCTTIKTESKQARHRPACRKTKAEENATVIPPL